MLLPDKGLCTLLLEKVIQHVIKEGMPCKFVPLEEQIESNAAFVALRERSTTKACEKGSEKVFRRNVTEKKINI